VIVRVYEKFSLSAHFIFDTVMGTHIGMSGT
jgi:hypothetical protein